MEFVPSRRGRSWTLEMLSTVRSFRPVVHGLFEALRDRLLLSCTRKHTYLCLMFAHSLHVAVKPSDIELQQFLSLAYSCSLHLQSPVLKEWGFHGVGAFQGPP